MQIDKDGLATAHFADHETLSGLHSILRDCGYAHKTFAELSSSEVGDLRKLADKLDESYYEE